MSIVTKIKWKSQNTFTRSSMYKESFISLFCWFRDWIDLHICLREGQSDIWQSLLQYLKLLKPVQQRNSVWFPLFKQCAHTTSESLSFSNRILECSTAASADSLFESKWARVVPTGYLSMVKCLIDCETADVRSKQPFSGWLTTGDCGLATVFVSCSWL